MSAEVLGRNRVVAPDERRLPIIETFGPTIQGEGFLAGKLSHFIRIGGCDYRCEWCDSLHAVLPNLVKENREMLRPAEVAARVEALPACRWVTLSGGNPAMFNLTALVGELFDRQFLVSVETQGSIWQDWLAVIDHLTISPKPPSSRMDDPDQQVAEHLFCEVAAKRIDYDNRSIKIVIFSEEDLEWAFTFLAEVRGTWRVYLSVGTEPPKMLYGDGRSVPEPIEQTRNQVAESMLWLYERVIQTWQDDPQKFPDGVTVLPQLHVLAWGHRLGV